MHRCKFLDLSHNRALLCSNFDRFGAIEHSRLLACTSLRHLGVRSQDGDIVTRRAMSALFLLAWEVYKTSREHLEISISDCEETFWNSDMQELLYMK